MRTAGTLPAVRRRAGCRGFRPALRAAVLVAGGAAAAAALLGGSAYADGRGPAPLAGGTPASVFLQRDLAASAPAAVEAGAGRPPAGASPANRISPRPALSRRRSSPPCAPRAGPARSSANSATTWSGPGAGCWPASTSWNCASPTAGTSPPSSNSTGPARAVRRSGRAGREPSPPVNVLTGRPRRRTASPRRCRRHAATDARRLAGAGAGPVGQPCVPLRCHLPGRRRHLHVRVGPARGAGRRRRGRPGARRHRGRRNAAAGDAAGTDRRAGTTSPPGWSAAWAGFWSCWPRDRRFCRGHAPCVTAESSQLRLRG